MEETIKTNSLKAWVLAASFPPLSVAASVSQPVFLSPEVP